MPTLNLNTFCIFTLTLASVILNVSCDSKKCKEKTSPSIAKGEQRDRTEDVVGKYPIFGKSGRVDVDLLVNYFEKEVEERWAEDTTGTNRLSYKNYSKMVTHVAVNKNLDAKSYALVINECLFKGFKLDGSQKNIWTVGEGEDGKNCTQYSAKSLKFENIYVFALKGFTGTEKTVRAAVIERDDFSVFFNETIGDKYAEAAALSLSLRKHTVQAARIFLPPQMETDSHRGIKIYHEPFDPNSFHYKQHQNHLESIREMMGPNPLIGADQGGGLRIENISFAQGTDAFDLLGSDKAMFLEMIVHYDGFSVKNWKERMTVMSGPLDAAENANK